MAGSARPSAPDRQLIWHAPALLIALVACFCSSAVAQELYKYRGEDGEWIYADRPPEDGQEVELRGRSQNFVKATVTVGHSLEGSTVELTARNDFYAPAELRLVFSSIEGLSRPDPDHPMQWILPPRSDTTLLQLEVLGGVAPPAVAYEFRYMPGDPRARHQALEPYRAPFAVSNNYRITQAYPRVVTHTEPASYYAIDLAMPIGTDVVAARAGIVFDVASKNFRGGLDLAVDGPAANVVRILHDDGTYAIYAHLNTNTIRVKPGDQVTRGQYIADSGNTGFSSGPHLHFAVVRNVGLRVQSVPITFLGADSGSVVPASGNLLTAY